MNSVISNKYRILFLGYALTWGIYFAVRIFQFSSMEIATDGEITQIFWGHFVAEGAPAIGRSVLSGGRNYHGEYSCPEVHFLYKPATADTGNWYTTSAESYAEHKPGEKVSMIFPKGKPDLARIYSLGEFWFTTPYLLILLAITLFWSIIFYAVFFIVLQKNN